MGMTESEFSNLCQKLENLHKELFRLNQMFKAETGRDFTPGYVPPKPEK